MAGVCHALSVAASVCHAAIAPVTVAISALHEAPSRAWIDMPCCTVA